MIRLPETGNDRTEEKLEARLGALRKQRAEAGYDDNRIWSITECDDTFTYGPPEHYVNHIGHTVTKERHDGNTYYEEKW
tara:strand:+ start:642 stop:878 length:237 start_codon:yes stop_codon:yes gene_type:complete